MGRDEPEHGNRTEQGGVEIKNKLGIEQSFRACLILNTDPETAFNNQQMGWISSQTNKPLSHARLTHTHTSQSQSHTPKNMANTHAQTLLSSSNNERRRPNFQIIEQNIHFFNNGMAQISDI